MKKFFSIYRLIWAASIIAILGMIGFNCGCPLSPRQKYDARLRDYNRRVAECTLRHGRMIDGVCGTFTPLD